MAMPAYVLAYAYTDALDPSGWLYRDIAGLFQALGVHVPRIDIRSIGGAGLVMGTALSPYVALLARNAFDERQGAALDAARSMGLSERHIFLRLALPMARPAWIAGLALVVMECFADFGTVAFFGVPTLSTGLFKAWFSYGDRSTAALLALLMVISVVIILWIEQRSRGAADWAAPRLGTRAKPLRVRGIRAGCMLAICALPGLLGFIFPLLLLLHAAIAGDARPDVAALLRQSWNTVVLGSMAVVVILPTAWIGALVLRQGHAMSVRSVRLASAGYAVPGLVVAVGLLALSGLVTEWADAWLGWRVALTTTGVLLVGAYLTRFFAVGLGPIESGIGRITRSLEWSASSLGLSAWGVVRRVYLPLMRGATGVAALLVFVDVVKELPATLVLRPFNMETLAVSAYQLASDELLAQAAWPAIMIAVVGLAPLVLLGPMLRGR
jgi:iron(III) transport system permease protein